MADVREPAIELELFDLPTVSHKGRIPVQTSDSGVRGQIPGVSLNRRKLRNGGQTGDHIRLRELKPIPDDPQ